MRKYKLRKFLVEFGLLISVLLFATALWLNTVAKPLTVYDTFEVTATSAINILKPDTIDVNITFKFDPNWIFVIYKNKSDSVYFKKKYTISNVKYGYKTTDGVRGLFYLSNALNFVGVSKKYMINYIRKTEKDKIVQYIIVTSNNETIRYNIPKKNWIYF